MIYFVTGNEGKLREVQAAIPDVVQVKLDLPEVQSLDICEVVGEKLKEAKRQTDKVCMIEDSGLYFDALGGKLPGPFIKWFEEGLGNQGIYELAKKVGESGALFRVVIGYIGHDGNPQYFEGEQRGTLVAPRGEKDFGWGPVFVPDGADKSYAEMEPDEKAKYSARAKAIAKLKEFWENAEN